MMNEEHYLLEYRNEFRWFLLSYDFRLKVKPDILYMI